MFKNLHTTLGQFRLLAFLEGLTLLLLLLVTMPLKYAMDYGEPNKVIGMVHGLLFILYVIMVFVVASSENWSKKKTLIALAVSVVPFGTFWADKKLFS